MAFFFISHLPLYLFMRGKRTKRLKKIKYFENKVEYRFFQAQRHGPGALRFTGETGELSAHKLSAHVLCTCAALHFCERPLTQPLGCPVWFLAPGSLQPS